MIAPPLHLPADRRRRSPWRPAVLIGSILFAVLQPLMWPRSSLALEPLMHFGPLEPIDLELLYPRLSAQPLSSEVREHGYHECNPPDPLELGPYDAYKNVLGRGRALVPQKGGHTEDMGFDVLLHFHGHEAVRKTVVQVARGIVFVGVDLGLFSGPYRSAFEAPGKLDWMRASIERLLKRKTGDDRAYINHLGLSAWSAGYGAINRILQHSAEGIDAVVLLDGLHAGYDPNVPERAGRKRPLSTTNIQAVVDYARRAAQGHGLFFFSHSEVDPVDYPSTAATAGLLLETLGIPQRALPVPPENSEQPFPQRFSAHKNDFYLESYAGGDTRAHCHHIRLMEHVVRDLLEPRWQTPRMDRDVTPTRLPTYQRPGVSG